MPVGGFSVGRDVSLTIRANNGILRLGLLTDFEAKPLIGEVKILGLDGLARTRYLPEGWGGSFSVTRQDSTLDDYWAQLEDSYYSGADIGAGIISETITEPDGSISRYRFNDVFLKLTDAGTWSGNKEVKQKLEWAASRRVSA